MELNLFSNKKKRVVKVSQHAIERFIERVERAITDSQCNPILRQKYDIYGKRDMKLLFCHLWYLGRKLNKYDFKYKELIRSKNRNNEDIRVRWRCIDFIVENREIVTVEFVGRYRYVNEPFSFELATRDVSYRG